MATVFLTVFLAVLLTVELAVGTVEAKAYQGTEQAQQASQQGTQGAQQGTQGAQQGTQGAQQGTQGAQQASQQASQQELQQAPQAPIIHQTRPVDPPPMRTAPAQLTDSLMTIDFRNSAEYRWMQKPVLERRVLDEAKDPSVWEISGTAELSFPHLEGASGTAGVGREATAGGREATAGGREVTGVNRTPGGMTPLLVEMEMFTEEPAPTSNRLSTVNLDRVFDGSGSGAGGSGAGTSGGDGDGNGTGAGGNDGSSAGGENATGEDWSDYNRLAIWIRADVQGFPMLPLRLNLYNDGEEQLPDNFYREGSHYVMLEDEAWQVIYWEITPLARDRITRLQIRYWVNKMLADPDDHVRFEIGRIELQRVEPDHYKGWEVASGEIAFSHSGYQIGTEKTAIGSDLNTDTFRLLRLDDTALPQIALEKPIEHVESRIGAFQRMDFSEVRTPGTYVLQAGDVSTEPFEIGANVWRGSILKALNFFFGERCGYEVPGSHEACHLDWLATKDDQSIPLNGGWHDAGDLSQGLNNTGEVTYAMFTLAEQLQERGQGAGQPHHGRRAGLGASTGGTRAHGDDPELLEALLREATWGLDWVMRVRFDGGYRIGFASNNLWTTGIIGDVDDRSTEALNNPNINYIAAAAGAIGARVLKDRDPDRARRALRIAIEDWEYANEGTEGPETWHTPAFAATELEVASIGALASMELYRTTGEQRFADKAVELARTITGSQQRSYVGPEFPLAGFFHRTPEQEGRFHQFHHANDQDPIVALSLLIEELPDHPDWMEWYATVAYYSEYLKRIAGTTEPYHVLPAYVYHEDDWIWPDEEAARHQAYEEGFREQVRQGLEMGDGYYLRAFPVWFARRGNYGVLTAQATALGTAARVRRDRDASSLAQRQAQWIVGRNPFVQSGMYGEGYNWKQQYSVTSGDFVGSLPVGMQSWRETDTPYWSPQNMFVYKEVWVHSTGRWIWMMENLTGPAIVEGRVETPRARRVVFEDLSTGETFGVPTGRDGRFYAEVPEGEYNVSAGDRTRRVTALSSSQTWLDLTDGAGPDLEVEMDRIGGDRVRIRVTAAGSGDHRIDLQTHNLMVTDSVDEVSLGDGGEQTLEWQARLIEVTRPWSVVAIPDEDMDRRVDGVGFIE